MIGARCLVLMGEFDGIVVGRTEYLGNQTRYAVRYMDGAGPQERWFTGGEISFDGREAEGARNVVSFERRVA